MEITKEEGTTLRTRNNTAHPFLLEVLSKSPRQQSNDTIFFKRDKPDISQIEIFSSTHIVIIMSKGCFIPILDVSSEHKVELEINEEWLLFNKYCVVDFI